jgi:hypothetical protein
MCYQCGKHRHFIAECPEAMEVKPEHKHRPRIDHKHRSRDDYKGMLTPKISTGKRLTCEPNWQKGTIRQEVFLKAFGRGVCGRECIVIRQKDCSTGESGKHSGMRDDVD